MRPSNQRLESLKGTAKKRGGGSKRDKVKPSSDESVCFFIELARSGKEGLPTGSVEGTASGKIWLGELAKQGVIKESIVDGKVLLVEGPENFGRVFFVCDRMGRSYELLDSEYARSNIAEPLLLEVCKASVYESILSLLRILTYPVQELREDPVLSELSAWIDHSEGASHDLERVSDSLSGSGFHELLRFSLSGYPPEDLKEKRRDLLADMAEWDISMFFAAKPPIHNLPSLFLSALFPKDEREQLLAVLRSSPSALRSLLMAKDARSCSISLASIQQTLPLLTRLFEIFAMADPKICTDKLRREWGEELFTLVDGSKNEPRPTPILNVLEARWRMDIEAKEHGLR